VRMARAQCYFKLKQLEKSLADCNFLVAEDASGTVGGPHNFADAYLLRAQIYDAMGQKDLAAHDRKTAKQKEQWVFKNAPFGASGELK